MIIKFESYKIEKIINNKMYKVLFIGSLYTNPNPQKHQQYYQGCLRTLRSYRSLFPNSQFALHVDESISEHDLKELSNYAIIYLHKYAISKRDYNHIGFTTNSSISVRRANTGKITKAMRLAHLFDPSWKKKFDFAISIDVHDDLYENSEIINKYLHLLNTEKKDYSFTYWKSSERTCFHKLDQGLSKHTHSDAGLLILKNPLPIRDDISYSDFVFGLVMKHQCTITKGVEEVLLDIYLDSFDFFKNNNKIIFHEHVTNISTNVTEKNKCKRKRLENDNDCITLNHVPTKTLEKFLGSRDDVYICSMTAIQEDI